MGNVLVLATALVPTLGHRDLIAFAASLEASTVCVLINGRTFEPVPGEQRLAALQEAFVAFPNVSVRLSMDDEAPQNPSDHPAFWEWWRDEVNAAFPENGGQWEFVVASEPYGAPVAEILGAEFMPYDIARELNPAKSTPVRADLWVRWDQILPEFRHNLQLRCVLFGQESVGKTTLARGMAKRLQADWRFEYARPLLESQVDPAVTVRSMELIHRGQAAVQTMAYREAKSPALFLDTDLYTTAGYWEIVMGQPAPPALLADAERLRGDVYYILPDNIPFEEDVLRYGGDRRTSAYGPWLEYGESMGLTMVEVPALSLEEKLAFIEEDVRVRFQAKNAPVGIFTRE